MKYSLRWILILMMLISPLWSTVYADNLNSAINIAGKQRMLSQKAAKLKLFLHLTVQTKKNHEKLGMILNE